MSFSPDVVMQQRRGVKSKLPTTAPAGQLIVTTDTNELYVGTGTSLAKINAADSAHKTTRVLFDDNVIVYADGNKGILDPNGREGWYYTNSAIGKKINWYYYDPTQLTTSVAQFNGTYAVVTLDTNKIPYFAVYTAGTNFGWYKSLRTYYVANPSNVTPGKYLIYTGANPSVYPELPRIQMTNDPSNTTLNKGAFAATETIAYVTIQTDSGASPNTYKFLAHNLGVLTQSENYELQLKIKSDVSLNVPVTTANKIWTINHNLHKRPSVTIVDENGNTIFADVQHPNDQQVIITFSSSQKGSVYLN